MDENKIYAMIEQNFKKRGYSVFQHIRNRQGTNNIRTADAIAISQSALRSTEFIGFEIKISKTDFLKELADIEKADSIAQYCNRWYLVIPNGIVSVEDVPEKWGLLEVRGNRLKTVKKAEELPAIEPTREFVAAIIRKVENTFRPKKEYWKGWEDAKEDGKTHNERILQNGFKELNEMREAVKTFEAHSGISFFYWRDEAKMIGEAVKLIKEGVISYRIKNARESMEKLLEEIIRAEKELKELKL